MKNNIIEDMKLEYVSDLVSEDALKESSKTGMYSHCGFAIEDYAGETGYTGKDLMNTRIVTGIISSDDKFTDEELEKLNDELFQMHPDIVVFDFWYHTCQKKDLSFENIQKVVAVLSKSMAFHDMKSYANRLAFCRTRDRLMSIEVRWNYGGEACIVSARNARAAYALFKTAPNHISDLVPCDEEEELKKLTWEVDEEPDEFHLEAHSSKLMGDTIDIIIARVEIPEGRVGYSLGYYAE